MSDTRDAKRFASYFGVDGQFLGVSGRGGQGRTQDRPVRAMHGGPGGLLPRNGTSRE